jgi:hypothetical protein
LDLRGDGDVPKPKLLKLTATPGRATPHLYLLPMPVLAGIGRADVTVLIVG